MRVDNVSYNNICLMPHQQYFSYIVARKVTLTNNTKYNRIRADNKSGKIQYFNIETHSINIYIYDTHSQCCLVVNMPHA